MTTMRIGDQAYPCTIAIETSDYRYSWQALVEADLRDSLGADSIDVIIDDSTGQYTAKCMVIEVTGELIQFEFSDELPGPAGPLVYTSRLVGCGRMEKVLATHDSPAIGG